MKNVPAIAAAEIRKELKRRFPNVNFSVKSKLYSGGDSVSISYIDGPLISSVIETSSKYELGHFNSSTDSYERHKSSDNLPKVMYIHVNRSMSPKAEGKIRAEIKKKYHVNLNNEAKTFEKFRAWPNMVVWSRFNELDLSKDTDL